ncbi:MAG TPA: AAA family ATPase [Rhizomicrobium sp.]|jgi:hypothetical protein|nr:AAA family ATPase [Rhizomicrobium sp.]
MTRFDPTLIVTRLVIERNRQRVYDEPFHSGVNIIRGENSSGKSTILNFIFYGLGGDLTDWSEVAALCSKVFVEVSLNGHAATLSRDISVTRGQPMDIYGGTFEAAMRATVADWIRYPYAKSVNRESFSQALFRLLGVPEVVGELSGSVTMHQILRLLYADQLSPVDSIFRFERFDPPVLRDMIGRLLCGAYDNVLYTNEIELRTLQRDFDSTSAELSSMISVLGQAQQPMTSDWLQGRRAVLEQERKKLQAEIEDAEKDVYIDTQTGGLSLKAQQDAYAEVQRTQSELGAARQRRDALNFEITDSAAFIGNLEAKVAALTDAATVAEHLGDIRFQACPACFAPITNGADTTTSCPLCKTPFDESRAKNRIVALINDMSIQLKQSRVLQNKREESLAELDQKSQALDNEWQHAARKLGELRRLPSTTASVIVRELNRRAGYLDREIENLEETARIIGMVEALSTKKSELNRHMTTLRDQNEALRTSQRDRLARAYTAIADEIRTLLKNDLRRQDSFENPNEIQFDFASNKLSVDGQTYFSASSRVILKSSFFLGFLAAATKQPYFRHPRFCVIDTIEDKGMEPQRSHNFQHQITRISDESVVDHQIIYATAMISPDLDEERYTVGKFSTRDEPTLAIRG